MPVTPQSARVRREIETAIVEGRHPPGARLDPDALADEFHCSRTPVREALQALAVSGLVVVRPKKGTYVARLGLTEIAERFELMAEIEGVCARLAARRITAAELEDLRAAHDACRERAEAGDADGYYGENTRFHQAIHRAARNRALAEEAGRQHDRLQPYRRMQLRLPRRLGASFAEHEAVLAAIEAGDGDLAARLLRDHVMVQGDRFNDLVAALREQSPQPA